MPVAPSWLLYLGIGLVGGVVAAALASIVVERLDRSVRSSSELAEMLQAPNIGSISLDGRVQRTHRLAVSDNQSKFAEDFRDLRTNLQFVSVDSRSSIFVIASAVSAEGKSTVAVNLCDVLAASGARTILVEADLRRPALSGRLGIDREVGLSTVLINRARLSDATVRIGTSLDYLPSGSIAPNPSELIGSEAMRRVLAELGSTYDYVILDGAPIAPVSDSLVAAAMCDGIIFVCHMSSTSRDVVREAGKSMNLASVRCVGTVMSMIPLKSGSQYGYRYDSLEPNTATLGAMNGTAVTRREGTGRSSRPSPSPRR